MGSDQPSVKPRIKDLIKVKLKNGKELYAQRFVDVIEHKEDVELNDFLLSVFPDEYGHIPYEEVESYEYVEHREQFDEFNVHFNEYYKTQRFSHKLPECRDDIDNDFIEYINDIKTLQWLTQFVETFGYSDSWVEDPYHVLENVWRDCVNFYIRKAVKERDKCSTDTNLIKR